MHVHGGGGCAEPENPTAYCYPQADGEIAPFFRFGEIDSCKERLQDDHRAGIQDVWVARSEENLKIHGDSLRTISIGTKKVIVSRCLTSTTRSWRVRWSAFDSR